MRSDPGSPPTGSPRWRRSSAPTSREAGVGPGRWRGTLTARRAPGQLADGTQHSNAVPAAMDADIQWRHSYGAGDRIYGVYDAASEGLVREHAERSGFPANRITPVAAVIGPDFA